MTEHCFKRDAIEQLGCISVPVSVRLCERSFPLSSLVELRAGTILQFTKRHDETLELYVNDSRVGLGRAVDIGERLGFRVEEVDASQAALAPTASESAIADAPAGLDDARVEDRGTSAHPDDQSSHSAEGESR